jgi:hypothetical protein
MCCRSFVHLQYLVFVSPLTLQYYTQQGGSLKGEFRLFKSTVVLLPSKEDGKQQFCFKLVSGVARLKLQATSEEEMQEWGGALLRACAIANGGGFLIRQELGDSAADELERKSSMGPSMNRNRGDTEARAGKMSYAFDEDDADDLDQGMHSDLVTFAQCA